MPHRRAPAAALCSACARCWLGRGSRGPETLRLETLRLATFRLATFRLAGPLAFRRMEAARAHEFVRDWVDAWNAHDVEAVLEHFADEVTFTSPAAARIVEGSEGVVRGKPALRAYWSEGIRLIPDLRFEVVGVYVGIDTLTINYRNQNGGLVNEVLRFEGPLVVEGHGTYLSEP